VIDDAPDAAADLSFADFVLGVDSLSEAMECESDDASQTLDAMFPPLSPLRPLIPSNLDHAATGTL